MGEPKLKKTFQKPEALIKSRDGLTPLTVAKLFQSRIKTLADIKGLSEDELKKLPLALMEYAAVKRFVEGICFESETAGTAERAGPPSEGSAQAPPVTGNSQ